MNTVIPVARDQRSPDDPLALVLGHAQRLERVDCAVLLMVDREHGTINRTAEWYSSSSLEEVIAPMLGESFDSSSPGLVEATLERRGPVFLPRLEDWEAAQHLRARVDQDALWDIVRQSSVISCPVSTALGRQLGALVILSTRPGHALRRSDLDLFGVLADLAALARERSELLRAEASHVRDEALLKRASEGISSSLDPSEVEREIVKHALEVGDADYGRLSRLSHGSDRLVIAAEAGEPPPELHGLTGLDGSEATSIGRGVVETARRRTHVRHTDAHAVLHIPVSLGPRTFGVLSVSRAADRDFDGDDVTRLTRLANSSAAAIANALDFAHEHGVATALTRGFIPESVPSVPGWDIGLLYEPAQGQLTGGDVYGVWPLESGEIALLIGDVAGKGAEAAGMSAMARYFIEAYSRESRGPADALGRASSLLHMRLPQETFVTAFLGFLDRRGIRYASAGHLAPLVLRGEGETFEVSGGGEMPLGIDGEFAYREREVELRRGDLLVAFTDGILEARREGELLGAERLEAIFERVAREVEDPGEVANLVHLEVSRWANGLSDDASIIALRRRSLQLLD